MAIIDNIKWALLTARKLRQPQETALLSTLVGEVETMAKSGKGELTDAAVAAVIKKFIKNLEEVIRVAPSDSALLELQVLKSFLPKQLNEDELRAIIDVLVADGAKDVGECMKLLKQNHAGTYDGAVASSILKAKFAK